MSISEPIAQRPASETALRLRLDEAQLAREGPRCNDIPVDDFERHLRREKRRADRSNAPLSLLYFDGAAIEPVKSAALDELSRLVCEVKRETDIVGRVGKEGQVAVLCPDTDEQGAQEFARKLSPHAAFLGLTSMQATYPDDLFQTLAAGAAPVHAAAPLFAEASGAGAGRYPLKRALDMTGALAALVGLAPLMLLVSLAIKLTSPGPVIFRQLRLGRGGAPFVIYKFRSMRTDVDDRIHRDFVVELIRGAGGSDGGGARVFKVQRDPRITRIGRLIRKTSLDELPQFFNVLKGDMSLVGPRPPLPYEAQNYRPWHLRRVLEMKPGMTGIWQVEGRSRVSFDEMVRMDLRYLREASLGLDVKLLLQTIKVVFRGDGAY